MLRGVTSTLMQQPAQLVLAVFQHCMVQPNGLQLAQELLTVSLPEHVQDCDDAAAWLSPALQHLQSGLLPEVSLQPWTAGSQLAVIESPQQLLKCARACILRKVSGAGGGLL